MSANSPAPTQGLKVGYARVAEPLVGNKHRKLFREVKQGAAICARVAERQPPLQEHAIEHDLDVDAVGLSGVATCIGVYFKPDAEHFFLAHVYSTYGVEWESPNVPERFKSKFRARLLAAIEDTIPDWSSNASNIQLMNDTLVMLCPHALRSGQGDHHYMAEWIKEAVFSFMNRDSTKEPPGWNVGIPIGQRTFGFVIQNPYLGRAEPVFTAGSVQSKASREFAQRAQQAELHGEPPSPIARSPDLFWGIGSDGSGIDRQTSADEPQDTREWFEGVYISAPECWNEEELAVPDMWRRPKRVILT